MSLKGMFKETNDINEKNVVGFASFVVMVVFAFADIVTGFFDIKTRLGDTCIV